MQRIIAINKVFYTVGINWRVLFNQKKKQFIKEASKEYDAYVLRPSQVGFLTTNKDEKFIKSLSLAASLKLPEDSFLGIFKLQDIFGETFYNLIAVHQGLIVGLGDSIFDSKEEAESRITGIEDLFNTKIENKIVCETYQESLDYLESHLLKRTFFPKYQIKPLYKSKSSNIKFLLIFIGILSIPIAYVGVSQYLEYIEKNKLKESRLFFLQDMEKRKKELQQNASNIFKQRWKEKALPIEIFQICQETLFALPMVEKGWALNNATCIKNTIFSRWEYQAQANYIDLPFNGTLKDTKEVLAKHSIKEQVFETNQIPFDALLSKNIVSQTLYKLTQDMGASLKLSFDEPETKEYKDLKLSISSPWRKGKFTWEHVPARLLVNDSLYKELESIPSLYLTEIKYNNQSQMWSIKGEFYVSF